MNKFETGYRIGKHYDAYKTSFPFLDYDTFCQLEILGKLGALLRGEIIELPKYGIFIEGTPWRQDVYKHRGFPAFL